jgi:periplasmic protein TonB
MDYAQQQRNPTKHMVGIAVVILLHIALVYALINGLGAKIVEVIKKPLETQIIEEVKPPPPPPPQTLPPPPKFAAPPPPFIPPPEVQVNVPPPPNPIAVTAQVAPTEPAPPIAAVAPPPAPPAAAPAPTSARNACPNYAKVLGDNAYPRDAMKAGIDHGEAVVRFTVAADGTLKDMSVVSQTNRAFGRAALASVAEFKCVGTGRDVIFEVPFGYKLN